ncbi:MAG: two-component regulator propeller domain-containing protein [Prolixibacteraceae bacterium]
MIFENNSDSVNNIKHNTITAIFEDKNQNLWVGTSRGLNRYNRPQNNFTTIDTRLLLANLLNDSYISSISSTSDSLLWIGTFAQGLFCLNLNSRQINRYHLGKESSVSVNITCIQADSINQLWIGTQSGLVIFDPATCKSSWYYNDEKNPHSISSNNITSIQKDIYGSIWIGTQDKGLNRVFKSGNAIKFERIDNNYSKHRISSNAINKLLTDDAGFLWIGTENDGLQLLDIQTGLIEIFTHEVGNNKSIGSNSVWSIYLDIEGRIWVGSYNKGISVYDANHSKFESFQINPYSNKGLINNDVRGFCENSKGETWIATDGGGVCRFNPKTRTFDKHIGADNKINSLTKNTIQAIICDAEDHIWLGTWGGGIDRLTPNGTLIKNYKIETENGIGNNKIRTIYQDPIGNIWAGTNGSGLFIYNLKNDRFEPYIYSNLLTDRSYITTITNSDNHLLVGSLNGLVVLRLDQQNKVIRAKGYSINNSEISSNNVISLLHDKNKTIWIGTTYGGINLFDPINESFRIMAKKEGLPSNNISGIKEDSLGNIWISSNVGISKINVDGVITNNFTKADGLNSNQFYSNSCLLTKNGTLLFGSDNGFNMIDPINIRINHQIPPVVLTNLRINNSTINVGAESSPLSKQIGETDTLILNYNQTSFTIDFVAINYTRPNQNQYTYQLEGYDDDWNFIGTGTSATYTKVKPGKYIFKVKGANNDGIWNESPKTLHIIINPPFWETKWAYIIYLLTFFIITYFVFRAWVERIQIRSELELEKRAKQKERELNEKNLDYFINVSHEFRTPLSLIIGPVESLINSSSIENQEQLKVIQRNSNRLLSLTNNIMNLRKLEDGAMHLQVRENNVKETTDLILALFKEQINRLKITLSTNFPETDIYGWYDIEKYNTILINLLSNAIKYTPTNGEIRVSIKHKTENNQIEISVSNNGVGIESSELPLVFDRFYQAASGRKYNQFGSGIGLALTKGLVELHGGKIWVQSIQNDETTFTFILPCDKAAYRSEDIQSYAHEVLTSTEFVDDYEKEEIINDSLKEEDDDRPIVLIVEDNSELRLFLKKELEKDYNIISASDGKEGLQKANKYTPDIIISDIVMPVLDGIELCKALKNDLKTSHIPIILLTAKTTTNAQIDGFGSGADAYIVKPFHLKLLQTQIASLIHSRRELYSRFSQDVYIMSRKQTSNDVDQNFLQSTINYILTNITDTKLNIESLSSLQNMSHRNFYRKIKALTGNTVVEFIKIVRLKEAVRLMDTQKYNLSEISYMTGFTSPSYFTKNFREFYGKPPSDYLNIRL